MLWNDLYYDAWINLDSNLMKYHYTAANARNNRHSLPKKERITSLKKIINYENKGATTILQTYIFLCINIFIWPRSNEKIIVSGLQKNYLKEGISSTPNNSHVTSIYIIILHMANQTSKSYKTENTSFFLIVGMILSWNPNPSIPPESLKRWRKNKIY